MNFLKGRIKKEDLWKLPLSIILCQLAGVVGSIFTRPAIPTWYQTLNKPTFNPPNWLFAPVWITLYFLMGISLFLVWRKGGELTQVKRALILFFIQLVLNASWSILFFGLTSPLLGFIEILILWLIILLTIQAFAQISTIGAFLLLPYFVWVSFAAVINFSIWFLNR
ncbi:MAG: TspO/MBR family protein [Thermodesulfobacteriota bacterium]